MNDYADREFDGHVQRTANRPLPEWRGDGDRTFMNNNHVGMVLFLGLLASYLL